MTWSILDIQSIETDNSTQLSYERQTAIRYVANVYDIPLEQFFHTLHSQNETLADKVRILTDHVNAVEQMLLLNKERKRLQDKPLLSTLGLVKEVCDKILQTEEEREDGKEPDPMAGYQNISHFVGVAILEHGR